MRIVATWLVAVKRLDTLLTTGGVAANLELEEHLKVLFPFFLTLPFPFFTLPSLSLSSSPLYSFPCPSISQSIKKCLTWLK